MVDRYKLIRIVAKKTHSKIKVVEPIIIAYEDAILEALLCGEDVWLREFVTFKIKEHKPKVYYDPATGERRMLKKKKLIKAVVSKCMNESLAEVVGDEEDEIEESVIKL